MLIAMAKYESEMLELEDEELEIPSPEASLYVRLFAYYLVQNKLYDAKFLWKRIPHNMKAENEDLKHLNNILQALICNDMADFFRVIERNWSDSVKTAIDDLRSITEKNVNNVVGNAYAPVKAENTIATVNDYQKQLKRNYPVIKNSSYKDAQQFALRFKYKEGISSTSLSEYQISRLTEFVSFLEN